MAATAGVFYLIGRESPYLPPVNSLNEDIPPANISQSPRLAPRHRRDRVSESGISAQPQHNNDHLSESRPKLPEDKMAGADRDHNTYTTMPANQRTPLLGQRNRNANEGKHAIFLRACHSPWSCITQGLLTFFRGLLAIYLVTTFILVMIWQTQERDHGGEGRKLAMSRTMWTKEGVDPWDQEMVGQFFKLASANAKKNNTSDDDGRGVEAEGLADGGWISIYRFETITLFIQMVYAVMTFSWSLMHLISPRRTETGIDSFGTKLKKFFSHPTGQCAFLFSLFYVMAVSFPYVVALVYWTIIVPARKIDVDDLFRHGQLQTFSILNLYVLGSLIAFFELFFLSSVRKPVPSSSHILGLTAFAVAYFTYTYIGHYFTGQWAYYFLNHKKKGFENVFVSLLTFISLLNIFYLFISGLIGFREAAADEEGHGYQQIRGVDGGDDDEEGLHYDRYRDRDDTE